MTGRFRPNERIRRRVEFQRVYERGTRIQGRYSTLFVLPNQHPVGRLGIAAIDGGEDIRNVTHEKDDTARPTAILATH